MNAKHVVHGTPPNELIFEWNLEQYTSYAGNSQGFLLCFRKVGTKTWTIFVDGTASDGRIETRIGELKKHGIESTIV